MTLEQHKKMAAKIKRFSKALGRLYCGDKKLKRLRLRDYDRIHRVAGQLDAIKSMLDSDYHNIIDDKTYEKLGDIYYGY